MSYHLHDFPYIGPGYVYIRNESCETIKAFVTKLSRDSGSDRWYFVPASFNDATLSRWNRTGHGWELISFKDANNTNRRVGFYVEVGDVTTYVTFRSFNNVDIKRVYPSVGIRRVHWHT
ncbi:hypothetical protein L218DRAFT_957553 [Marasmius fiardii PR-910]|nr:hypothetical protein L218DRAFT_957553 [Marasmius fiardii PR-910]